jgi:electron transfer flavoprotein alpha subunit
MTSAPVVVCSWAAQGERVPCEVEEVLTLARRASVSLAAELHWLVLGPPPQGLEQLAGQHGVAALDGIDAAKLADFQPDAYVEALAQYCAQRSPRLLLFSQSYDARLVAPRLAGRLGAGVVMNAVDLEVTDADALRVVASAYGGDTRVVYELAGTLPCVVAVLANAVVPEPGEPTRSNPTFRALRVDLDGVTERIRVVQRAESRGPRLEDAEIIVSGGRGLGSPENYKLVEELAQVLGGLAAASRPLVDDGWVDPSRQVGLTGKITRPALYVAAGISGASQHMAGCSAAKTLVAINRDADAAIFRYARYGIVGDCVEILPELIRAAKERVPPGRTEPKSRAG